MTIDRPAASVAAVSVAPIILPSSVRQSIFFYLGILIVLLAFGGPSGGLFDIPISFFLKNKLHLRRMRSPISASWPQSRSICPLFSDLSAICGIRLE
jgi:hypothetical protein